MRRLRFLTGIAAVAAGAALGFPGVASAASPSPWTQQTLPPPGTGPRVVSCPTATDCIAIVGGGSADVWNGSTWTATTLPTPAGVPTAGLNSIACPAAGSCTAVGDYLTDSGETETIHVFADQLSGSTWTLTALPLPATTVTIQAGNLVSVSCASATSCVAVGKFNSPSGHRITPLAEIWNGTTWTATSPPVTGTTGSGFLNAVSCASATNCTAVGYYYPQPGGAGRGLAEQWNGTAWSFQPLPIAASSGTGEIGNLFGISCPAAGDCTAVGDDVVKGLTHPVAEFYNGSTWKYQSVPAGPSTTGGTLESVSCVGTACTATGNYNQARVGKITPTGTLADVTTGGAWSYQATVPVPKSYNAGSLGSVSCTAAATCTAVGYAAQQVMNGGTLGLAERK